MLSTVWFLNIWSLRPTPLHLSRRKRLTCPPIWLQWSTRSVAIHISHLLWRRIWRVCLVPTSSLVNMTCWEMMRYCTGVVCQPPVWRRKPALIWALGMVSQFEWVISISRKEKRWRTKCANTSRTLCSPDIYHISDCDQKISSKESWRPLRSIRANRGFTD